MAVNILNPKADVLKRSAALSSNCNAAKGLQEVLKSNLGPRGTMKMLVGGAGQIKITKDGNVLLGEMQIQHPTASMIARAATAQDEVTGDGTTSNVLLIGEMMRIGERLVLEQNVHPRILCDGIELARKELLSFLDGSSSMNEGGGIHRIPVYNSEGLPDKELLHSIARTSLRSKIHPKLADHLTPLAVDSVLLVKQVSNIVSHDNIDLFMIEILHMIHRSAEETRLIKGMCLDHGARHPDMPESLTKCYILTLNVSLEYEKSEVNSGFFYSDVSQREKLVCAEREFTDKKVRKIIELKRSVCTPENKFNFVVLNQKGIDPPSLDLLAKENIIALRRVKRRNMERLTLCCGGEAVNCVADISPDKDLGYAEHVYQQNLGEDRYTFVEGVRNPQACTILLKGPNDHTIAQMKDGFRDGLRAVKTALDDGFVIPGAGAFELMAYRHLQEYKKQIIGKKVFGIDLLAEALISIPKTLLENSGLDCQECLLNILHQYNQKPNEIFGIDISTGDAINPISQGIFDTYKTKRHLLSIAPTLTQNLLQIDEIIRAGKSMSGGNAP